MVSARLSPRHHTTNASREPGIEPGSTRRCRVANLSARGRARDERGDSQSQRRADMPPSLPSRARARPRPRARVSPALEAPLFARSAGVCARVFGIGNARAASALLCSCRETRREETRGARDRRVVGGSTRRRGRVMGRSRRADPPTTRGAVWLRSRHLPKPSAALPFFADCNRALRLSFESFRNLF